MNKITLALLSAATLSASAFAQFPAYLMTYSQPEQSVSGSGGTVLGTLWPNEIHYLDYGVPCTTVSAEKWLPRTAAHVMAGDENADGTFFRPNTFGDIDALLSLRGASGLGEDQRTIFWSVSVPMGNAVSAPTMFRPGDVARLRKIAGFDGKVQYFMRQEMFNMSLGMPVAFGIDIDAIAFQPNYGVFFSVDVDIPGATTACGPMLVRDGDVLCIPPWALTYTSDMRVASVAPNSAVVAYSEAAMNAFTAASGVTNRFGACIPNVIDVESLEIDIFGPATNVIPCAGFVLPVPNLIYSTETGTGGSLLETAAGGQIHNTLCGPAGTGSCAGPTFGPQVGIQQTNAVTGAPSHVNALAFGRACVHVLEPQQHVMNVFPLGAPAGANNIDYNNPFPVTLYFIELVLPPVPTSFPAFPFSPTCFPDLYAPSLSGWSVEFLPFGTFPMPAIPPLFTGKVLFQGVGFPGFELSTPAVVDVQ